MEGCRKIVEFTINQPTEIFAQATMVQPVQCFGFDDGMAYGTATGGTPPYTYVWDSINGQSGQNAINLTPEFMFYMLQIAKDVLLKIL